MLKLIVILLLVKPSQSRTIKDLDIPFTSNIFDYIDEDFVRGAPSPSPTTSSTTATITTITTTTTTTTTTSTTTTTTTTTTSTTTTTTSTTTSTTTTTTKIPDADVVRVFHSGRSVNLYEDGPKRESISSDIKLLQQGFADAIKEIRSLTEKQVAGFEVMVQEAVRNASQEQRVEIDRLRDAVNDAVRRLSTVENTKIPPADVPTAETSVDSRYVLYKINSRLIITQFFLGSLFERNTEEIIL